MAYPQIVKDWIITANNRITFVSLLDTMQRYLHGAKTFLKARGYTVKGSASAGTGAMDGVDRWTATTDVTPRATIAGASQAWIILTDGNGCDILLTFQGATDDVARISFSPGGLFVAAGTPNQQPTATDEQVIMTATSLINATASLDRLWFGWATSDRKMCRFAIARGNVWVGVNWGVEQYNSAMQLPATATPAVWGFGYAVNAQIMSSNTQFGVARITVAGNSSNCLIFGGEEVFSLSFGFINVQSELSLASYPILPVSIATNTGSTRGKVADLVDVWRGKSTSISGDLVGSFRFIGMAGFNGVTGSQLWPWDGTTDPVLE